MKQRSKQLVPPGLVLLVGLSLYWLWLAPGGAPGCDATPACISSTALDTSAFDFDADAPELRMLAVSADGETLIVGLTAARSDDGPSPAAIAAFDASSGEHLRTYLSEPVWRIQQVALSPDETIVATSYFGEGTSTGAEQVQLFDAETTDALSSFEYSCSYALGLSPDNTTLQCENATFDVATGNLTDQVEAQDRLATHSLSDILFYRTAGAEISGDEVKFYGSGGNEEVGITFPRDPSELAQRVQLQGTLDGTRAVYIAESQPPSFWKPLPQRVDGGLVVFDLVEREFLGSYRLDSTPVAVAITADASRAILLDTDFVVQIFRLDFR